MACPEEAGIRQLKQLLSVHILTHSFFKMCFNVAFPYMNTFPKCSCTPYQVLRLTFCVALLIFLMRATGPAHLIPLDCIEITTFYDAYCELSCAFILNIGALPSSKTLVTFRQIAQCHNVKTWTSQLRVHSYWADLGSSIFVWNPLFVT